MFKDAQFNHHQQFEKLGQELNILRHSNITHLNIEKSVSDLDDANRKSSNPLKQELPLECKNLFIDVINFALKENRELLYTIIKHSVKKDAKFDKPTIIQTANIYMKIAAQSGSTDTTFKKL